MGRKVFVFGVLFTLMLVLSFNLVTAENVYANGGNTYYVSTEGSDEFGNGTETWIDTDSSGTWTTVDTGPWRTIQHAINQASSGDTILVGAGTYAEGITIDRPLTLAGTNAANPPLIDIPDGDVVRVTILSNDVILQNLYIRKLDTNCKEGGANFLVEIPGGGAWPNPTVEYSNIAFKNILFEGRGRGAFLTVRDLTIENCTFREQPISCISQEVDENQTAVHSAQESDPEASPIPDKYLAQAPYQDSEMAEESFSPADEEEKEVGPVGSTFSLSDFSISPTYSPENKLISAKVAYGIDNLEKPQKDVKVMLKVALGAKPLEEKELVSFSALDVGSWSGSYNYSPSQGWQEGASYGITLELYAGDELRYHCDTQRLAPEGQAQVGGLDIGSEVIKHPVPAEPSVNWLLVIGIIAGAVIVVLMVELLVRRRSY